MVKAREVQVKRYDSLPITTNGQMRISELKRYCRLDEMSRKLLEKAFSKLGMSARAYHRILRVARTIADLAGSEHILSPHLTEAISYRRLDRSAH